MNTQHDNTAGKGFRVKNPPQVDGHAASAIERNYIKVMTTTLSQLTLHHSALLEATSGSLWAGQESGLGPPDKSARQIKRGYARTYWSREEKKQMLLGKSDLPEKQWTAEEKWVLTWSIEYAKRKFKKATER